MRAVIPCIRSVSKHILSVSYNESLLRTRELILQRKNYEVTSALGFTDAADACKAGKFDLLILGHSIPSRDKAELTKLFRSQCAAPILALQRPGESPPHGADAHADPNNIDALLETVDNLLSAES